MPTPGPDGEPAAPGAGPADAVAAEPRSPDVLGDADVGGRVVRGGAQRAIGFVAANVLTLAGAVILTRHLGVEDFGRFGTVMALLAVVQGIADAGLTMTGSRELALADEASRRRELLADVLGLRVVLTAAGIVLAVLFTFVAGYDETLIVGTAVAGVGIFLVSVQSAMLLPLGVEMRNGTIAVNEVLRQLVLVGGWAILAVAGAALLPFFAVQLVVGIAMLAITPALLARHHFVAPRWDAGQIRALAAIGLPVAVASFLGVIYFRVLVVMMSLLSDSAAEVGYYVTSSRVIETVTGLPVLLITVVVPVLTVAARDNVDRVGYMTARMTEAMLLAGVLIALVLTLAARPIVLTMAGQEYEPAVEVLQIQCVALVTIFAIASWNPALIGTGHVRALAWATYEGMPEPSDLNVRGREVHELPWGGKLVYYNCIVGGAIDVRFLPSILKGVMEKMVEGPLTGSYVRDVRVCVFDGKMHPVDSNDISFKIAGLQAFRQAFQQADPQILEPMYHVEVLCPEDLTGAVIGDLQTRRAMVEGMDTESHFTKVIAKVPLAEMQDYSSNLRSFTQGRAKFRMHFLEYEPLPFEVQRKLADDYSKVAKEEMMA